MDVRFATNPDDARHYGTDELRRRYLVQGMFTPGELRLTYSHQDRVVLGGAVPLAEPLRLGAYDPLRTAYFAERRELAVFCTGGRGTVTADGAEFDLGPRDLVYLGMGTREIALSSADPADPARLYLFSTPAHQAHPAVLVRESDVEGVELGSPDNANVRTLRKYVDGTTVRSCQLMMGYTALAPGSVWNTMPAHTHVRRTECYLYFDLGPDDRVLHLMGRPEESRHLVVADREAVISPSWSMHSGAGTANYSFVWAMAGENYDFADMDHVAMDELR
ncbi:5-dehydro-4-deoxy-D-glucuronate isomerase [Streptomonospora nanhaiensis]|uniref:4-deoxy-L-threo-5-hexosulose-uronate ketol-isomerase n=1 Tax=Streptomonospora nanhaiensis TaxID=1323731 RepID=A0A853BVH0_9ACTN|nr:5-dehydro-4-deoxy-D-glucuronate isomerase [Streptomonospora nanhaiensis]MBV2364567.1 5-dehydro-4-deoxy-D-glucuronate isomerase [Streptomonospora nanhaiensis]MBX9390180.1 5-dehydro-4-deoxy-D-glucuronate isomerase [Streptomonospora nanhaiensis]NYI99083.1 4-deoxy-L-threo-5-hexosulose-uronate ketol-isomerase [Streptomonospora nanhaiensis]